jgi:hypothetical protein
MPLLDAPPLFEFEIPSCEDFKFMPLAVRYNLDRFGKRISLAQWQALPYTDRVLLARFPLDDDPEIEERFVAAVSEMVRTHANAEPLTFTPDASPPWQRDDQVPEAVVQHFDMAGLAPPETRQWAVLPPFQRYVLAKLTRKPELNHDFLPAVREFELL